MMAESETTRKPRFQRLSGRLGRCAAGVSTFTLGISVAAMAMAQMSTNGKSGSGRFQAAPKSPEAEAVDAEAAAQAGDMILGIPANTVFYVAVGVIALFWFTMGGGRKAKVTGQQS
jgi:ribose/xylose/arabinose/galactoside ABC-type transport system permease subunit